MAAHKLSLIHRHVLFGLKRVGLYDVFKPSELVANFLEKFKTFHIKLSKAVFKIMGHLEY